MGLDVRAHRPRRLHGYEPEVDRGSRLGGDGVRGLLADVARAQAADVDRRCQERLVERRAIALGAADLELAAERGLHRRNGRDRRALGGARWRHLVEEAMDRGPALLVAQAREQLDEACGGVRYPVSVVAVV